MTTDPSSPRTPGATPPLSLVRTNPGAPVASHEQEMISALLETGTYNPTAYGIPDAAFVGNAALHAFCADYQQRSGCAPPVSLVTGRFPSYLHTYDLDPRWAAHQLRESLTDKALRKGLTAALQAVKDEAYGEALGIMRDTVSTVSVSTSPGRQVTDFAGTRDAAGHAICPIPPGRLSDLTGGHGAGQVWFVAALWGVGKTFKLVEHAVAAAESGWDVLVFSMEMHTEDFLARLRQQALRGQGVLHLMDIDAQEAAMAAWSEGAGKIEVRGPDAGRVDASVIAGAITQPRTLVVLDYVGKMFATDGRHARTGWDVYALISAELSQIAGLMGVPVLAAAQINRKGELAGTVALEQDADLILHQARVADNINGIRKNTIYKSRMTALAPPWYSRFDPVAGDFADLSGEEAMRLRMSEETSVWD